MRALLSIILNKALLYVREVSRFNVRALFLRKAGKPYMRQHMRFGYKLPLTNAIAEVSSKLELEVNSRRLNLHPYFVSAKQRRLWRVYC